MATYQQKSARLIEDIARLKKERDAVIVVHNYQLGEVQDIADLVGDSLELSRAAASMDAGVIVFCGVHFMAETAYILSPDKTVLLPRLEAGCPMADMITARELLEIKKEHPKATVVCYVNSSAEVKAYSDVCCTSANAVQLVERLDASEVLFVPDQYLGRYVADRTGKKIILWPGYCPTHARITEEHILSQKRQHPDAVVIAHPECRPEVTALSDAVLSTSGMSRFVQSTDAKEIIVATEMGIIHRLRKDSPDKVYIPATEQAICPNMKLITLGDVYQSLLNMAPVIKVPEDIRLRAKQAVDRMIQG